MKFCCGFYLRAALIQERLLKVSLRYMSRDHLNVSRLKQSSELYYPALLFSYLNFCLAWLAGNGKKLFIIITFNQNLQKSKVFGTFALFKNSTAEFALVTMKLHIWA